MKIDYEYIKDYLSQFNYTLISDNYERSNKKLDMICNKGHECSISWDNFKYGRRCKTCASLSKANKFKLDYSEVKEYIESYGCKLLDKDYKNNSIKLHNLKIWIEYDGEFHYEMVYDGCRHDKVVIYDKLKDEYARKHNWKLIRIPYWEFDNIEDILKKELKHGINLNDQS